ncbi:MAG: hypothetical protein U0V70_14845 [Terriglobia bacterium]
MIVRLTVGTKPIAVADIFALRTEIASKHCHLLYHLAGTVTIPASYTALLSLIDRFKRQVTFAEIALTG